MTKRLYRSRENNVIAGVAGGIAEYLDIDPVLVRIGFVVTTFAGGFGILTYIIAWIIMPEAPREEPVNQPTASTGQPQQSAQPNQEVKQEPKPHRGSVVGGLLLISLGLLFLADNFLPHFHFEDYWPLILVAIGAGLLYKAVRPVNS